LHICIYLRKHLISVKNQWKWNKSVYINDNNSYLAHSSWRVAKCALRTEFPSFSLSSDFSIFVNRVGSFVGKEPVHLTIWDFAFSTLCSLSIISNLHTVAQGKGTATEVSTPKI